MAHHYHGPDNAEHELRKAYNSVIEHEVTYGAAGAIRRSVAGVDADEVGEFYRRAFRRHRDGDRLAAERWARATKHLARAFWHEAKVAYFDEHASELPYLEGAIASEEYGLHERLDTTVDLLDSLQGDAPPGSDRLPADMRSYLARGREHLAFLAHAGYRHELARAERIKAAHEYGRVVECLALAYEAENRRGDSERAAS
jgi:hypothetical protein